MPEKDPCRTCTPSKMNEEGCCTPDVGFGLKVLSNGRRRILVCRKLIKMEDNSWGCGVTENGKRPSECSSYSCEDKLLSNW